MLRRCLFVFQVKKVLDASVVPIANVRNIGIVAHIDAGKTTTTERMLFYSGMQHRIGDVDKGNTTTDFMEEEAQRGITIQAAAVTLAWKSHVINLIDTPGHVDFTMEVERSLRVLDGVVALFDGAVGVQGQSYTVLKQARKHNIPVIAFINKMDKPNSNFVKAVGTLKAKLKVCPACIHIPLGDGMAGFEGVIDVVDMKVIRWKEPRGSVMDVKDVKSEAAYIIEMAEKGRKELLNELVTRDEALLSEIISMMETQKISEDEARNVIAPSHLKAAIKRLTNVPYDKVETPFMPVLCGAARRDQGVQPLLDAVLEYLPNPLERPAITVKAKEGREDTTMTLHPTASPNKTGTVSLVFKVMLHNAPRGQQGMLSFFRVYSGKVAKGRYYNATQRKTEHYQHIYVVQADQIRSVDFIPAGSIGAIYSEIACTGDTVVSEVLADKHLALAGVDIPRPVVGTALEPQEAEDISPLMNALRVLCREDPSLTSSESETGEIVLKGQGDLHLEIIVSRLKRQFSLACTQHPPIIEYRETLTKDVSVDSHIVTNANGIQLAAVSCRFTRLPHNGNEEEFSPNPCTISVVCDRRAIYEQFLANMDGDRIAANKAADRAVHQLLSAEDIAKRVCRNTMANSPTLHTDMIGGQLIITKLDILTATGALTTSESETVFAHFSSWLMKESSPVVVEPYMYLEVMVSDTAYVGPVMKDLTELKAASVEEQESGDTIQCIIAMRHLGKYSERLRKLTKGHAQYWYRLDHYRAAPHKQSIFK
eukprot:PhF_6_TR8726/c0_g3_i1/m.13714/K02355/fusA, GFM, EFG; elongation factor G